MSVFTLFTASSDIYYVTRYLMQHSDAVQTWKLHACAFCGHVLVLLIVVTEMAGDLVSCRDVPLFGLCINLMVVEWSVPERFARRLEWSLYVTSYLLES